MLELIEEVRQISKVNDIFGTYEKANIDYLKLICK